MSLVISRLLAFWNALRRRPRMEAEIASLKSQAELELKQRSLNHELVADFEQLAKAGHLVEWHIREHLGHGIDPTGQSIAGHFIACALRAPARP